MHLFTDDLYYLAAQEMRFTMRDLVRFERGSWFLGLDLMISLPLLFLSFLFLLGTTMIPPVLTKILMQLVPLPRSIKFYSAPSLKQSQCPASSAS